MSIAITAISGGGRGQDVAGEMAERIKDLVHEYDDRVPLALAVGVLDIVRHELLRDAE